MTIERAEATRRFTRLRKALRNLDEDGEGARVHGMIASDGTVTEDDD